MPQSRVAPLTERATQPGSTAVTAGVTVLGVAGGVPEPVDGSVTVTTIGEAAAGANADGSSGVKEALSVRAPTASPVMCVVTEPLSSRRFDASGVGPAAVMRPT